MILLLTITIGILFFVLYKNYKLNQQLKLVTKKNKEDIENLTWTYNSNLQLIKKTIKTRIAGLEKCNRELRKNISNTTAMSYEKEQELKREHEEFIAEITRYKIWKFNVKHGAESSLYPDRIIVVAKSKETAEQLIQQKYNLDNISMIYDIVQSRRSKDEILLESYDIL